ncbi:MAG: zinc ribbon domain-containing protein [Candidatus Heimdallarchaeota archaeon]
MSYTDIIKKRVMWPYLAIGGITFLAIAGIKIHAAILAIISGDSISNIENIIGTVCFFTGFVSIIALMIVIGGFYGKSSNTITTAIILLVLFIGFELFISLYPGIDSLGGLWGNIVMLIVYGILRGIALRFAYVVLDLPRPYSYKTEALKAYGWSFLIFTVLAFIFAIIGGATYSFGIIMFAFYLLIGLYFFEALCLLFIGIKFIQHAYRNSALIVTGLKPVTTTIHTSTIDAATTTLPITTESHEYFQQDTVLKETNETTTIDTEKSVEFCANCGVKLEGDSEFCDSCGEAQS